MAPSSPWAEQFDLEDFGGVKATGVLRDEHTVREMSVVRQQPCSSRLGRENACIMLKCHVACMLQGCMEGGAAEHSGLQVAAK